VTMTLSKGGAVIHTLRETVGTERALESDNPIYLSRHKFQNVKPQIWAMEGLRK